MEEIILTIWSIMIFALPFIVIWNTYLICKVLWVVKKNGTEKTCGKVRVCKMPEQKRKRVFNKHK